MHSLHTFDYQCQFLLIHVRYLQIIHMPYYCHLLAVSYIVYHTWIIPIQIEPFLLHIFQSFLVKKKGIPKCYVQILLYLYIKHLLFIFHPLIFLINLWIYLFYQFRNPTMYHHVHYRVRISGEELPRDIHNRNVALFGRADSLRGHYCLQGHHFWDRISLVWSLSLIFSIFTPTCLNVKVPLFLQEH